MAVATELHATPTAMMRLGVVGEPQDAGFVLATFHQTKVGRREQIGSGFRHGAEKRFGGIFSHNFFNLQRARLIPHKPRVTVGVREKSVKERRISSLSSLSFLDERANILTQLSRRNQKGYPRCARPASGPKVQLA